MTDKVTNPHDRGMNLHHTRSSRPILRGRPLWTGIPATTLLVFVAASALKRQADHRLLNRYEPGVPAVKTAERIEMHEQVREIFIFEGYDGDDIPVASALPTTSATRHPAIVFLYGAGMTMRFSDHVADLFTEQGFALFMPEQFGQGRRSIEHESGGKKILNARRRALLTGAESRRLLDVLATRADIDPNRIYFVGVSFGAIFGCHAVAADPRFQAAALVMAGGDFNHWIADQPGTRPAVLRLAKWMIGSADPIHSIGNLSPRPILLLNSSRDEIIPESAARALYHAAGCPKEQRWHDVSHKAATPGEVALMLGEVIQWLGERERQTTLSQVKAADND